MVRSQSVTLRAMTTTDLPAVCAIEKQVQYAPWTDKLFADGLDRHLCLVAEQGGQIVGFAVVQFVLDEASLLNIAVDPQLQKQGIGRILLDEVIHRAMVKQATTVFLEVRASNRRAITLYQMAGFNEMGLRKNYYPSNNGKEDAVMMALMVF